MKNHSKAMKLARLFHSRSSSLLGSPCSLVLPKRKEFDICVQRESVRRPGHSWPSTRWQVSCIPSWKIRKLEFDSTRSSFPTVSIVLVGLFFAVLVATDKEPENFQYPPLDPSANGIRLLVIQPGKRGTNIKCELVSASFEDNPAYEALSYEWGDGDQREAIWLNGAKIQVRKNLWEALGSLREIEAPRTIWVDFLCIDQANAAEKNEQIPLMAFIYRRAQRVLIWLGSHEKPVDRQHERKLGYAKKVDVEAQQAAEIKLEYFLHSLIQEEYWKRAWIIQEVGMASKVTVCHGTGSMEWEEFIQMLNWYRQQNPYDAAAESILKLNNMRRSKFTQTTSFKVHSLIDEFRDAFCALPHDKVYAFIGLANDTIDHKISVNYQKSLSEVYRDVLSHHFDTLSPGIEETPSIEAIYLAALIRRLLTREKIRLPRKVRTVSDTVKEKGARNSVVSETQPSISSAHREESHKERTRGVDNDYAGISSLPQSSFNVSTIYSRYNSPPNFSGIEATDDQEEEESEADRRARKDASWEKTLLITAGIIGTTGLAYLLWKFLGPSADSKHLTWCWKESSVEDFSAWTMETDERTQGDAVDCIPHGFLLRGAIVSRVEKLGPSISKVTSSYDAERRWTAELGRHISNPKDLATARGLNEKLLSLLSSASNFQTQNIVSLRAQDLPPIPRPRGREHQMIQRVAAPRESPVLFFGSNQTLGLVPPDAREGDLICQFWNSSACAVLRKSSYGFRPRYEIVGRAAVVSREERADWDIPTDRAHFVTTGLFSSRLVDLRADVMAITRLSLDTVALPGTWHRELDSE